MQKSQVSTSATRELQSGDYLEALRGMGYSFRMNDLDDKVEVRSEKDGGEWQRLSDAMEAAINTDLRDAGLPRINVARDAYIAHAHRNRYHPVKDYLSSLVWDGCDHIAKLASYFPDEHDQITYQDGTQRTVFHAFFRRWLVGAVGKALHQEQNAMLVLAGAQGKGKSYFVQWLAADVKEFFTAGAIRPDNHQEFSMAATTKFIWEVGELGATTRRADVEALKDTITRAAATYKPPYGHNLLDKPIMSSFIGTVNDNGDGFLVDDTGNRRFLTVGLVDIDRRYSAEINPSQVWAQAVALYNQGERGEPLTCEVAARDAINLDHMVRQPVLDYIRKYFNIDPERADKFTHTSDIARMLEEKEYKAGTTRALEMEIGKALSPFCAKRKRDNRWGFVGVWSNASGE